MATKRIKQVTSELWWTALLTGILSILFGVFTIVWPGIVLASLIIIFAVFVLVLGIVNFVRAFMSISTDPLWWLTLLFSLVCIGLGIYLFSNPPATVAAFVIFLGIFIILQAIFDLVIASYAKNSEGQWLWILSGVLGLIFGIIVFFYPESASLAFVWVLGVYALIHGIMIIAYTASYRSAVKKLTGKKKRK